MANHNEHIPEVRRAAANMPLRFSFKYLDLDHPKFSYSKCCTEYFVRLFQRMFRLSNGTVDDFIDQNNRDRRHIIDFSLTTEPDGFQHIYKIDPEQLGFHEGWQFAVYPEDRGNIWRAHGILIDDTFFVVWLDQDHLLFP